MLTKVDEMRNILQFILTLQCLEIIMNLVENVFKRRKTSRPIKIYPKYYPLIQLKKHLNLSTQTSDV